MQVKSSLSEPSKPPATYVPSGGSGSHTSSGIRRLPRTLRQPRPRTVDEPVPEEPLSLRRVTLQNLRGLSLDRVEVHPRRPLIHVRVNLPPRPLIQVRQPVPVQIGRASCRERPEISLYGVC